MPKDTNFEEELTQKFRETPEANKPAYEQAFMNTDELVINQQQTNQVSPQRSSKKFNQKDERNIQGELLALNKMERSVLKESIRDLAELQASILKKKYGDIPNPKTRDDRGKEELMRMSMGSELKGNPALKLIWDKIMGMKDDSRFLNQVSNFIDGASERKGYLENENDTNQRGKDSVMSDIWDSKNNVSRHVKSEVGNLGLAPGPENPNSKRKSYDHNPAKVDSNKCEKADVKASAAQDKKFENFQKEMNQKSTHFAEGDLKVNERGRSGYRETQESKFEDGHSGHYDKDAFLGGVMDAGRVGTPKIPSFKNDSTVREDENLSYADQFKKKKLKQESRQKDDIYLPFDTSVHQSQAGTVLG